MPNTLASQGTSTPGTLFTRPIRFSMKKSGIMVICAGITSAPSRRRKMRSRPQKRSLAKA